MFRVVATIALLGACSFGQAEQKPAVPAPLVRFLRQIDRIETNSRHRQERLEARRLRALAVEKKGRRPRWEPRTQDQLLIRADYTRHARSLSDYQALPAPPRRQAALTLMLSWLRRDLPAAVRDGVSAPKMSALLHGLPTDERRRLLAAVASRMHTLPLRSDLDALIEVMRWESTLLGGIASPESQLDALSKDLIQLFTERDEGGLARSKSRWHVPGRFSDGGFKNEYRDQSDQVRHFCWAFRMFAASPTEKRAELVERIAAVKERIDAQKRGTAPNEADLKLNTCARRLVSEWVTWNAARSGRSILTAFPDVVKKALGR